MTEQKTGTIPSTICEEVYLLVFKGEKPKNYPVDGSEILPNDLWLHTTRLFSICTSTGIPTLLHQQVPGHIDSNMSNENKKKHIPSSTLP